ncbi:hypothetical protein OXV71_04350 [Bacteroides fragilis]|nr:hypothetical protein [Bacteroides fragilis]
MADKKEHELTQVSSVRLLRGLDGNNESVLISPSDLPHPFIPCAYIFENIGVEGWYRIASGLRSYNLGALLNIGNTWGHHTQAAGIYSLFAFNDSFRISKLDGYGVMNVDKIRYVYHRSNLTSESFIDIHYSRNMSNPVSISASCITNLTFTSDFKPATIPEEYTAIEIST